MVFTKEKMRAATEDVNTWSPDGKQALRQTTYSLALAYWNDQNVVSNTIPGEVPQCPRKPQKRPQGARRPLAQQLEDLRRQVAEKGVSQETAYEAYEMERDARAKRHRPSQPQQPANALTSPVKGVR